MHMIRVIRSALRLAAEGGETEGGSERLVIAGCRTRVNAGPNTASRQRGINAPDPKDPSNPLIQRNTHIQEIQPIVGTLPSYH